MSFGKFLSNRWRSCLPVNEINKRHTILSHTRNHLFELKVHSGVVLFILLCIYSICLPFHLSVHLKINQSSKNSNRIQVESSSSVKLIVGHFITELEAIFCGYLFIFHHWCWTIDHYITELGACLVVFLLVLAYFPAKPERPPSISANVQRMDFRPGFSDIIR